MTRKVAKNVLKSLDYYLQNRFEDYGERNHDAMMMAIKALEQKPCEDAISRDELLKAIDTWDKFGCDADTKLVPYQDRYIPYIHYDDVVKCIKGMPSVTPKPKMTESEVEK